MEPGAQRFGTQCIYGLGLECMLKEINQKHWSRFRKEVIAAAYEAVIYYIRQAYRGVTITCNFAIQQVKYVIKERVGLLVFSNFVISILEVYLFWKLIQVYEIDAHQVYQILCMVNSSQFVAKNTLLQTKVTIFLKNFIVSFFLLQFVSLISRVCFLK